MEKCNQPRVFSLCSKAFAVTTAALVLLLGVYTPPVVSSTVGATEHGLELDALAEVLGIPMDEDVGPKRERLPEFLETVYDCWNSGSDNCGMPEGTSDANVVRSFLGFGEFPLVSRVSSGAWRSSMQPVSENP